MPLQLVREGRDRKSRQQHAFYQRLEGRIPLWCHLCGARVVVLSQQQHQQGSSLV